MPHLHRAAGAVASAAGPTYDGGGPAEDARTRAWYDDLARAIGDDRVRDRASSPTRSARSTATRRAAATTGIRLLRYGVNALSRAAERHDLHRGRARRTGSRRERMAPTAARRRDREGARLHAERDAQRLDQRQHQARARGSRGLTGGKHFVINTAENGRGPVHERLRRTAARIKVWCNPAARGSAPRRPRTRRTRWRDAYLWINRPGYAQCVPGPADRLVSPRALSSPAKPPRNSCGLSGNSTRGYNAGRCVGYVFVLSAALWSLSMRRRLRRRLVRACPVAEREPARRAAVLRRPRLALHGSSGAPTSAAGQHGKAALIWRIAREPKNVWVGRFTSPNFRVKVQRIFDAAQRAGRRPAPHGAAGAVHAAAARRYDGGGPAEDARTREWYRDLARAIGSQRAVIAFEPDSLGTIDCHARSRRAARYRLLRYGVEQLTALPNVTIYIEAGASDWEGAPRMAPKLRRVGVAKARGLHAERDPLRLDPRQHQVRAGALAAASAASTSSSTPPRTGAARSTSGSRTAAASRSGATRPAAGSARRPPRTRRSTRAATSRCRPIPRSRKCCRCARR